MSDTISLQTWLSWHDEMSDSFSLGPGLTVGALRQAVADIEMVVKRAVFAERERCAKIAYAAAETPLETGPLFNAGIIAAAKEIAARIRSGE